MSLGGPHAPSKGLDRNQIRGLGRAPDPSEQGNARAGTRFSSDAVTYSQMRGFQPFSRPSAGGKLDESSRLDEKASWERDAAFLQCGFAVHAVSRDFHCDAERELTRRLNARIDMRRHDLAQLTLGCQWRVAKGQIWQ